MFVIALIIESNLELLSEKVKMKEKILKLILKPLASLLLLCYRFLVVILHLTHFFALFNDVDIFSLT